MPSNSLQYILKHECIEVSQLEGPKIFLPYAKLGLNNSEIMKYISHVKARKGWISTTIYAKDIVSRFRISEMSMLQIAAAAA